MLTVLPPPLTTPIECVHGLQSKILKEEANTHLRILSNVENDFDSTSAALRKEAEHAELARKNKGGICWMYIIIILELFTLSTLLYFGLS